MEEAAGMGWQGLPSTTSVREGIILLLRGIINIYNEKSCFHHALKLTEAKHKQKAPLPGKDIMLSLSI